MKIFKQLTLRDVIILLLYIAVLIAALCVAPWIAKALAPYQLHLVLPQ